MAKGAKGGGGQRAYAYFLHSPGDVDLKNNYLKDYHTIISRWYVHVSLLLNFSAICGRILAKSHTLIRVGCE